MISNDIKEQLRGRWVKVFLHGRNDEGVFVNTIPGYNNVDIDEIEGMLQSDEFTTPNDITRDAEALGFGGGDVVVTTWFYDSGDFSEGGYLPYHGYKGVSKELTDILCGTKEEQAEARDAL